MKNRFITLTLILASILNLSAQPNVTAITDPLEVVRLIGDKLIRDTPFQYRLTTTDVNRKFNGLHYIDFGRSFGQKQSAVAYAFTQLTVQNDTTITIQIAHTGGCKIWINGSLIYQKQGKQKVDIRFE
jgi:hypothetical protein